MTRETHLLESSDGENWRICDYEEPDNEIMGIFRDDRTSTLAIVGHEYSLVKVLHGKFEKVVTDDQLYEAYIKDGLYKHYSPNRMVLENSCDLPGGSTVFRLGLDSTVCYSLPDWESMEKDQLVVLDSLLVAMKGSFESLITDHIFCFLFPLKLDRK